MLTQQCLLPTLTSTMKLSLFTHVHSSPLSLAVRWHQCHANLSHYINKDWTFSDRLHILREYDWIMIKCILFHFTNGRTGLYLFLRIEIVSHWKYILFLNQLMVFIFINVRQEYLFLRSVYCRLHCDFFNMKNMDPSSQFCLSVCLSVCL